MRNNVRLVKSSAIGRTFVLTPLLIFSKETSVFNSSPDIGFLCIVSNIIHHHILNHFISRMLSSSFDQ